MVHFTILKGLRFRLFARRDIIRRMMIEENAADSFTHQHVQGFICKVLCIVPALSFVNFVWFACRQSSDETPNELTRFRKEASPELQRLNDQTVMDAMFIMMLNSPITVIFVTVYATVSWAFGRVNKMMIVRNAEQFVGDLPEQFAGDLPIPQPA